ncbi:alpha/beta fold hydrolase [Glycomyces mayteni]|uniref:Alpha/beta fold hydrolase n=1 Tax=Glycomyces mayteni TaxID=543887 RepID=A0ABW2DFB3_9ACTN|nr:alpha/beta hydrolase [Glycomyces mayteni]
MTNISANPIVLDTRVSGTGPGIVLAHGATGSIDANFGPLIPLLAEAHTVTASDYPADDTHLELDALADALVADAATERFALIGFSLGTAVAVRAAVRHPDRVAGLVLAAGIAKADNRTRLALDIWDAFLERGDRESFARFALHAAFSPAFTNGLPPQEVAAALAGIAGREPGGAAAQLDLIRRVDTTADLAAVAVPTLVVAATGDLLVDPANHRFLAAHLPGAEYAELESGHVLMAEKTQEWHRLVLDFLERHGL